MKCPKCQCEKISNSGVCLRCGYLVNRPSVEMASELPAGDYSVQPDTGPQDAGRLIETVTSGRFGYEKNPNMAESLAHPVLNVDHEKDRRILLVRFFSGLLDWLVVVFGTVALILTANYFSGINFWDSASMIHYSMLLLLVYFLYSLFFLGLSSQTIGMMIAGLQVVSEESDAFLRMPRAFARCCCYLLSLCCLGTGLIWAFFDSENRCLHDRWTDTRVARVHATGPGNRMPPS